jgi:transcriptional regulator NrdR family protein
MECPRCKGKTEIFETRQTKDAVRRRRHCTRCGHKFTTIEQPAEELVLVPKHMLRRLLDEIIEPAERIKPLLDL